MYRLSGSIWFIAVILCVSFAVLAEEDAESQSMLKGSGIGFNIGMRIHFPEEINTLIDEIWEEMQEGVLVISQTGSQAMFLGLPIKIKGIIFIGPFFCIEPFGQFFWSGKVLRMRGDVSREANVNILDLTGGCNFWFKVTPKKTVSFKLGAGGYGGYTTFKVSGDYGDITMTGPGYGGNVLAGIDITLKKVAINIDFIVPIGSTEFQDREGELKYDPGEIPTYPEVFSHTGFEIRPGITILF